MFKVKNAFEIFTLLPLLYILFPFKMSSVEEDADIPVQGLKRGVPVPQVASDSMITSEDGPMKGLSPKRSGVVVRRQSVSKVTIEVALMME